MPKPAFQNEKPGFPLGFTRSDFYHESKVFFRQKAVRIMSKIEDFGDHIAGARKELYARWRGDLERAAGVNSELGVYQRDWSAPLSELWPEPNYERARQTAQTDNEAQAIDWARALRDELGAKPRAINTQWMRRCAALQQSCLDIVRSAQVGGGPHEFIAHLSAQLNQAITLAAIEQSELRLPDRRFAYEQKRLLSARRQVMDRAYLYSQLGHSTSLKEVESVFDDEGKKTIVLRRSARELPRIYRADTWDEAIAQMKERDRLFQVKDPGPTTRSSAPKATFMIVVYPSSPNIAYIAAKTSGRYVNLLSFPDKAAAKAWVSNTPDSRAKLMERLIAIKDVPNERTDLNAERTGFVWRKDGENVTPQSFIDTFGFRGVQFGNYVEGARRQVELNQCYDALMDLAYILDAKPQALSLDCTLGLAFGARGKGGKNAAMAHFEPHENVINLTKNKGAGSLAHEWFHALDCHLAGNDPYRIRSKMRSESYESGKFFTRPEFAAMLERSKTLDQGRKLPYWSRIDEMGARAFESFVKDELARHHMRNDYLVNIRDAELWDQLRPEGQNDYPYPRQDEQAGVSEKMRQLIEDYASQYPKLCAGFPLPVDEAGESESAQDLRPAEPVEDTPQDYRRATQRELF